MPESRLANSSACRSTARALRVIEPHPPPQRRDGADHGFLAGLHRATYPTALGMGRANEVAASRDDPGRWSAERLLRAEEHEVGAHLDQLAPAIFGRRV